MTTPTSLLNQPVIEAIFELRFSKETQVSEIVPGYLFHSLNCEMPIVNLPASQIPKNVREEDEQLHYAGLNRLTWGNYYIYVSDHGISVSTKGDYLGWSDFKSAIKKVHDEISKLKINENLLRYSLKYIDFFPSDDENEPMINKLDFKISIAGEELGEDALTLRIDKKINQFSTGIQVLTHAIVMTDQSSFNKKGMILDIDTVMNVSSEIEVKKFIENTDLCLDEIHDCNKKTFFKSLKTSTIEQLSPVYNTQVN